MDNEEIEAKIRELDLKLITHKMLLTVILAEFAVSNKGVRATLEDILAQAVEAREVHIPPDVGDVMPEVYRITRDLLDDVNRQLTIPLQPRSLEEKP